MFIRIGNEYFSMANCKAFGVYLTENEKQLIKDMPKSSHRLGAFNDRYMTKEQQIKWMEDFKKETDRVIAKHKKDKDDKSDRKK